MHAHEDRLVVSVCVGSHGRESLGMNSSMQAMASRCGAWGWTCALSATVGVVACISLPCNPINSNTIPENVAPLAAPKTHRVRVEFVRVFLLAAHRALLAAVRRLTPERATKSTSLRLTSLNFLWSTVRFSKGAGRSKEPLKSDVLPSSLPSSTPQLGPPDCMLCARG